MDKEVQYFKALKQTKRFNKNQKVWIRHNYANNLEIRFKWRGKGRYVNGDIDKFAPSVGEIKTIPVDIDFAKRILGISNE